MPKDWWKYGVGAGIGYLLGKEKAKAESEESEEEREIKIHKAALRGMQEKIDDLHRQGKGLSDLADEYGVSPDGIYSSPFEDDDDTDKRRFSHLRSLRRAVNDLGCCGCASLIFLALVAFVFIWFVVSCYFAVFKNKQETTPIPSEVPQQEEQKPHWQCMEFHKTVCKKWFKCGTKKIKKHLLEEQGWHSAKDCIDNARTNLCIGYQPCPDGQVLRKNKHKSCINRLSKMKCATFLNSEKWPKVCDRICTTKKERKQSTPDSEKESEYADPYGSTDDDTEIEAPEKTHGPSKPAEEDKPVIRLIE